MRSGENFQRFPAGDYKLAHLPARKPGPETVCGEGVSRETAARLLNICAARPREGEKRANTRQRAGNASGNVSQYMKAGLKYSACLPIVQCRKTPAVGSQ